MASNTLEESWVRDGARVERDKVGPQREERNAEKPSQLAEI